MRNIKKIIAIWVLAVFTMAHADDIDILNAEKSVDSNILFIMDVSGSMSFETTSDLEAVDPANSRLSTLKNALATLLNDPTRENVNVGLSSFAGDVSIATTSQTAHGISYPVSSIDELAETVLDQNPLFDHPGDSFLPPTSPGETTREYLQTIADTWTPYGGTPIVDALFEAALYFRGLPTNWGRHDPSKIRAAHPSTYVGLLKDVTTTSTEYQCNNQSCSGASCNGTETCSMVPQTSYCSTPSCGTTCTGPTTVTQTCPSNSSSCGNGTNCSTSTTTVTRNCITNSEFLCRLAHPTWYDCNSVNTTNCSTTCPDNIYDEFGNCTNPVNECVNGAHQQCKEDIDYTTCDANQYQCTSDVEQCTHEVCGDVTTSTTTLTGTATFISPIKEECPANGIILLSDGLPSANLSATLVKDMIGPTYANGCDAGSDMGRCGPELAKFLANEDNSSSVDGDQFVKTFTIGLSLSDTTAGAYLQSIAEAGDGQFVNASTTEDLVTAFNNAIDDIAASKARSFASPSYSVDTSNLLSHGGDVYVPVFDKDGVVWPGNLKKFKLVNGVLKDADSNNATNDEGALLDTARDYWSSGPSDNAITSGGAANKIDPTTRNIKTDNGSAVIDLDTSISNANFGLGSTAADTDLKAQLVKFIKGFNPDDTARNHMGDILHSKPIQLTKADGSKTIFVGTNEGYLHAINDVDGTELFAYMPSELLPNINKQFSKTSIANHLYGVDGPITLWLDERATANDPAKFGNKILDAGEKAYLFFGLRRGGKHYYALDVTVPNAPVLKWKKQFGTGDSWSQPVVAMLKEKNKTEMTPVLVLGGGYNEDISGNQIAGGNAVYIVDAIGNSTGGDIIWTTPTSTGLAPKGAIDASDAVPSRIRVIDVDRNGSIDRLYFGDTGGNIWRVDLDASYYDSNTSNDGDISQAKLYKISSLGSAGSDSKMRKFFEEPDVAIFRKSGKFVATIAIGSGDRTRPLDDTNDDKFFVLYDEEVLVEQTAGTLKLSDLTVSTAVSTATTSIKGWYKNLTSTTGEKVLSTAITFQNKVMFTTFGTTSINVSANACDLSNTNEARLYIMDLLSGNEDLNEVAATGEILGTPQIVFNELQKSTGGACIKGDCIRKAVVRVGKAGPFDLPAPGNASPVPESVPRVFWIDND